jgi:uncharacterized membrane protein
MKSCRVKVRLLRRVGQFIPEGIPLLMVSKGDRLAPENSGDFRRAFDLGPSRTLQQDVEFGVLQIVDIALKAISPAVNDSSTAISSVDQLSRILIRFASREPPESLLYEPPGVVRVSIPWIDFDRLVDSASAWPRSSSWRSRLARRHQPIVRSTLLSNWRFLCSTNSIAVIS